MIFEILMILFYKFISKKFTEQIIVNPIKMLKVSTL